MPRSNRAFISSEIGSYHIISRTAGDSTWFNKQEKEYLMVLLEHFASGFFVKIHTFCIMSNHFHILLSGSEQEAEYADNKELLRRYRKLYGKDSDPPVGSTHSDGSLSIDDDGGMLRLRTRLGSVSRFIQEFKQSFSCWYNKRNNRKGYLWGERFKGLLVDKGDSELVCSAYIDLNPVRGGMVNRPEDYRWSGLGLRVRDEKRSEGFLYSVSDSDYYEVDDGLSFYRQFVYESGGVGVEGKGSISKDVVVEVEKVCGRLDLGERLRYRVRNLSEGVAIGSEAFIAEIQRRGKRKFVRPRSVFGKVLYVTRVLRL